MTTWQDNCEIIRFVYGRSLVFPAEIAWITLFSDTIHLNRQGYWEASLPAGIDMIYIPVGDFIMGSAPSENGFEPDDGSLHRVRIKGIWIGKTEMTRGTWRAIMGGNALQLGEENLPHGWFGAAGTTVAATICAAPIATTMSTPKASPASDSGWPLTEP